MFVKPVDLVYGADPELFFTRKGRIVGAEKIIPQHGLKVNRYSKNPEVALDGVQIELHPAPGPSIAHIGSSLGGAFVALRDYVSKQPGQIGYCFDAIVDVGREELDSLSPESRELGCKPSKNVYGMRPLLCDPKAYTKRSPGGHLHFDLLRCPNIWDYGVGVTDERHRIIPLLDLFVGNTFVMLDRDMGQVERRVNYGRAGEYRDDKNYGIEYRTLSAFWLRAYPLVSLAFGMGNFAIACLNETVTNKRNLEGELVDLVKIDRFIDAIEKNDFYLARNNFESLLPFFRKYLPNWGFPITNRNIEKFLQFADATNKYGIAKFLPNDPVTEWCSQKPLVEFDAWLDKVI